MTKIAAPALLPVALVALLLGGCGGGGGNPGACTGSTEVCAAGQDTGGTGITPSTSTTTATSSTTPTDTAVCSQFANQAAAQQYFFTNTAPQLDPDGNGIACDN